MRHIGNGHVQTEPAGQQLPAARLLAVDRIVEVASILAVDGDERQMAQVDALVLVLFLHLGLEPRSLLEHRLGPYVRNIEAAQRDVDLHARRHVVADHLDDIALRLEALRRPVSDLHLDELTRLGIQRPPGRDQHFLLNLGVVRNDETDIALDVITAHDALVSAADHLDDGAFAAPTAIEARDTRQTAVTIEHQAHLRRAEEQVVAAIIRDEEAKTVTMAADAPADQVQLVHRGIGAAPGVDQLAVSLHRTQAATQRFDIFVGLQPELFHQLFTGSWRATFAEMLKNQLTAGNRVFVLFRFTSGLGIEGLPIGH